MQIAYTMGPGRGDTDLLLSRFAQRMLTAGLRPVGAVQTNTECDHGGCDMDVQVLPQGAVIRISQSLGPGSRGCRLDPAALERAVGLSDAELALGADCLIVNKFGKHEADGRGFRPLIGEALSRDIPVLVGVNRLNLPAFHEFTSDLAEDLAPNLGALQSWLERALRRADPRRAV